MSLRFCNRESRCGHHQTCAVICTSQAQASGLNGAAPSPVGLPSEQEGAAAAAPLDGVKLVGTYDGGDGDAESMSELDARIKAGVYSDIGSTKDRITRPLRRALAKDPIGPGAFGRPAPIHACSTPCGCCS